jgi:transport family protein 27
VDFCVKVVNIPETNAAVELYLFDTAGQSIFNQREHGTKHWENASMVVLVYDVGNRDSFAACAKWLQNVRSIRPNNPVGGVLLANKIDLRDSGRAQVTVDEGMEFAKVNGLEYFECSAQQGTDVDAPFNFIADAFYRKYEECVDRSEKMS